MRRSPALRLSRAMTPLYYLPTLVWCSSSLCSWEKRKKSYTRAASARSACGLAASTAILRMWDIQRGIIPFLRCSGIFPFGDYFKKDAVLFAWELLTGRYALPKDKLWVSVYQEDDEAERLWKELTDIDPIRIVSSAQKTISGKWEIPGHGSLLRDHHRSGRGSRLR